MSSERTQPSSVRSRYLVVYNRQEAKHAKGEFSEPSARNDDLARRVIGAAIEIHRHLGPGFLEAVYDEALAIEFALRAIPFSRQPAVEVLYKGEVVGQGRPDYLVGGSLVVEIKAVRELARVHHAQVMSYLRAFRTELGLLLNFRTATLREGIRRIVWSGGQQSSEADPNNVSLACLASWRLPTGGTP